MTRCARVTWSDAGIGTHGLGGPVTDAALELPQGGSDLPSHAWRDG